MLLDTSIVNIGIDPFLIFQADPEQAIKLLFANPCQGL
jgi:hypothetical protein